MEDPNQATLDIDKASFEDLTQSVQTAGRERNASAAKDVGAARSHHDGASLRVIADSSTSSHGPAKLTVRGADDPLEKQIIAHDFTNQVFAYLVTALFFALIALLMFSSAIMPEEKIDVG